MWVAFSLASSSSSPEPHDRSRLTTSNNNGQPNKRPRVQQQGMRINRSLRATHSRREVNRFISQGRITRNGILVTNPDARLAAGDTVQLDEQAILWEEEDQQPHRYLKYNKPRGIVTTTDQRIQNNIMDEMKEKEPQACKYDDNSSDQEERQQQQRRVYPIGRLDAESTGLILLTSDGDVVNPLLRFGGDDDKAKEYHVMTNPEATNENIQK